MANVKNSLLSKNGGAPAAKPVVPLQAAIMGAATKKRFEEMLGKKAAGFLSSLITVVNNNSLLAKASTASVLAAAGKAAALDLPIEPSLGQAYIVPYKGAASFQIGYKGVIALAQRSGLMKSIVMTPVYEGEIRNWNRFTETYEQGERTSDAIVGYFARFELVNGFAKATYWTKNEVIAHAKRFSKAYNSGPWQTDFDAMACKTVLLSIMKTYAPMSLEMQTAFASDEKVAVVEENGDEHFEDIEVEVVETAEGTVNTETGELFPKE